MLESLFENRTAMLCAMPRKCRIAEGGVGVQVQWTEHATAGDKAPPTCVLVHGILGSRKNMISFAHRIVEVKLQIQN